MDPLGCPEGGSGWPPLDTRITPSAYGQIGPLALVPAMEKLLIPAAMLFIMGMHCGPEEFDVVDTDTDWPCESKTVMPGDVQMGGSSDHPNMKCVSELEGNLTVGSACEFLELRELRYLKIVRGDLRIVKCSDHPRLSELGNLELIGGELEITGNRLGSGLWKPIPGMRIDGDVTITGNTFLCQTDVDAFVGALSVGGSIDAVGEDCYGTNHR